MCDNNHVSKKGKDLIEMIAATTETDFKYHDDLYWFYGLLDDYPKKTASTSPDDEWPGGEAWPVCSYCGTVFDGCDYIDFHGEQLCTDCAYEHIPEWEAEEIAEEGDEDE